jgi:hypothetical protein
MAPVASRPGVFVKTGNIEKYRISGAATSS